MADLLLEAHLKWINHLQPEGLVVAAHTLVDADVAPRTDTIVQQREFLGYLAEPLNRAEPVRHLQDTRSFLCGDQSFLKWPDPLVVSGADIPESLRISLSAFGNDTLEPTLALRTPSSWSEAAEHPWQVLVREESLETDFDKVELGGGWQASPQARLERLLRETQVPIGVLVSPLALRLVYAPRGENAGHLTFKFEELATVAGRAMLGALEMLLGRTRLFAAATHQRLPALLRASRDAQARVSAELSQQVLASLYELLRGFARADDAAKGKLLSELMTRDPQTVYQGLLTVLLRLVFLLYAEDRGLMPQTGLYQENYSVHGLWARLRDDAARFPDTMDQRFGAWARLVALFKAVYSGSRHPDLKLPARLGHLFDPSRFPFLEGPEGTVPLVPDGTLYRILENLLVLGGEKLSYRTLDVEQIGSVYESIMGFTLVTVSGLTLALKPAKKHGAPPVVDLEALLQVPAGKRDETFRNATDRKLAPKLVALLKAAHTVDDLLDMLRDLQDVRATPHPLPPGGWILVPTEERRKSGSHYTPRSLTAPVVEKALKPVWLRLGQNPTPEAIQELKICDPAMGSGAFLVETCRQVAARLVDSWKTHSAMPVIPPDEDEQLYARRVVAQRCLYGVDRNPMAVDLAKLSLWLATLAKDHPFTFLDHAMRAGDSLVGLSRNQAVAFHWHPDVKIATGSHTLDSKILAAQGYRLRILHGDDLLPPAQKAEQLRLADSALQAARDAADLTIHAFFASDNKKKREQLANEGSIQWKMAEVAPLNIQTVTEKVNQLRSGEHPVIPFHWELEFPEVFFPGLSRNDRTRAGFDAMVGNPPFAGKNTIASGNHPQYLDWLKAVHEGSHGNADLSAHFFRRCFDLVREAGSFGLIATNTIAQGDTRSTGLRYIRTHDGLIYDAVRRVKWPGEAAVVVSTVHILKQTNSVRPEETAGHLERRIPIFLDNKPVPKITAFLFHDGGDENPATLKQNADKSFQGSIVLGMGFTFDDTNPDATPLAEMHRLIESNPRNQERIFPYIGGEEVNDSPTHAHHRYVINFGEMPLRREDLGVRWVECSEDQAKTILRTGIVPLDYPGDVAADWPDLLAIVEAKVKPDRLTQNREIRARYWWRFGETTPALFRALEGKERVLAISRVSEHFAFGIISAQQVSSERLALLIDERFSFFASIQSRIHEIWKNFFQTTHEDRGGYQPEICFETFPFSQGWESDSVLEGVGREYHDFRAALMVRHSEGLTKTYNRFHDPAHDGYGVDGIEPEQVVRDIDELRRLHNEMDRAVLSAYGWTDIDPACEFQLDYEDDEPDVPQKGKGRKKPWRLRFPDPVRDDILARLLKLNARYALEEGQDAKPVAKFAARSLKANEAVPERSRRAAKPKPGSETQGSLL